VISKKTDPEMFLECLGYMAAMLCTYALKGEIQERLIPNAINIILRD